MTMFTRRTAVLLKSETTYGTDPTPDAANDAVLAENVNLTPLDAQYATKGEVRPYMGNMVQIPTASPVRLGMGIHITGSGAAGTAPAYAAILQALGLAETVNAGTSVVYAPISDAFGSASTYTYIDGVVHQSTGMRGTGRLVFRAGELPMLNADLTGLYVAPSDAALPTLTTTAWKTPLAVNKLNTTLTLFGHSAVGASVEIDLGCTVVHRDLIGAEDVIITDRQPSGTVSIEATTVGVEDWWAHARAGDTDALQLVHGTVAGAIVQADAPAVQLTRPRYADQDGVRMFEADFALLPVSGNDEFTLTIK